MHTLKAIASQNAAVGVSVTVQLPVTIAGQRARIHMIEVCAYNVAARTGSATPVLVTTTNMGGLTMVFPSAGAIGTVERRIFEFDSSFDAPTQGLMASIVCPATANVRWFVNVV